MKSAFGTVRAVMLMLAGGVFFWGCDRPEDPDTATFIEINGEKVSTQTLFEGLNYEYQCLYARQKAKVPDINNVYYTKYRPWRLKELVGDMINSVLMAQEAKRCGIVIDEKDITASCQNLIRGFADVSELKDVKDVDELEDRLRVAHGIVRKRVTNELIVERIVLDFEPRITNVTAQAIAEAQARTVRHNADAELTNKVQRAKLDRIRKILDEGADFAETAVKYSEHNPDEGKVWESYFYEDMTGEKEQLRDWAFSAKVGDVGGPFEINNGFCLVKLARKDEGSLKASSVSLGLAQVHLVRITMPGAVFWPVRKDSEMAEVMKRGYRQGAMKKILQKLQGEARIHYPNGGELSEKFMKALKAPPKKIGKNVN